MARASATQCALLGVAVAALAWTSYRVRADDGENATSRSSFDLLLSVSSIDGAAVTGARAWIDERACGETDANGKLEVALPAAEGSSVALRVVCPTGYAAAPRSVRLALTPLRTLESATPERHLAEHVSCEPLEHDAVLVVRVDAPRPIPVIINGQIAGTTDAAGIASFGYRLKPNATLRVELDSRDAPELVPQSPTRTFTMPGSDTCFVFEQSFRSEGMPMRIRRPSSFPRLIPYRLN